MFSKEIYNLTLTSDIAAEVFPNICGRAYGSDNTFLATLRALLASRMTSDDTLWLEVGSKNDRHFNVANRSDTEIVRSLVDKVENNTIFVFGLNGTENWNNSVMQSISKVFAKEFNGFVELEDLSVFSRVKFNTNMRVYINEEDRIAVVFIVELNTKRWHYIQYFTPRYFPWYFKESPVTEEEKLFAKSLTLRTSKTYEQLIESYASKYDFRGKQIQKMVGGLAKRTKQKQVEVVKREIMNQENRIERNRNDYLQMVETLQDLRIRESGLMWQIDHCADDHDLVDYFTHNHHINIISVSDNNIEIIIGTTIESYDPDLFERMERNTDSYLYTGYEVTNPVFKDVNARKKLIDAMFGDDAIMGVKVCAYYNLKLSGNVTVQKRYPYPKPEYEHFLTNPHFYFFACLGTYDVYINEALRNGDYVYAVEQCVLSAKTLNLTEGSQTVAPFMGLIFNSNKEIIKMPDGTSCTPEAAYNWLISQENNTQEVEKNVKAD